MKVPPRILTNNQYVCDKLSLSNFTKWKSLSGKSKDCFYKV